MTEDLRKYFASLSNEHEEKKKLYCVHREKTPVSGSRDVFHCRLYPDVVHCCGQRICNCPSYKLPSVFIQLELFN